MFSILEFVDTCRAHNTRADYLQCMLSFIEFIYDRKPEGRRNDEHRQMIDKLSVQYLQETRNNGDDLFKFLQSIKQRAPTTQHKWSSVIDQWFVINDIEIKRSKAKVIKSKLPRNKVVNRDIELSQADIKTIYDHMSLVGRAMMMIQISGGLRIGEVSSFTFDDMDLESIPAEIRIRSENAKNGEERYCFISSEAVALIREWLRDRDRRLQVANRRGGGEFKTDINDPRVFPFARSTIRVIYVTSLKKSGLYELNENGRYSIRTHSFRKYFISQMKTAMTADIVELLAGHAGYLSGAYRRYDKDQVRAEYLKAEYAVSLNAPDVSLKMDLENQKSAMQVIMSENLRARQEMDELKARMDKIQAESSQLDADLLALPDEVKQQIIREAKVG